MSGHHGGVGVLEPTDPLVDAVTRCFSEEHEYPHCGLLVLNSAHARRGEGCVPDETEDDHRSRCGSLLREANAGGVVAHVPEDGLLDRDSGSTVAAVRVLVVGGGGGDGESAVGDAEISVCAQKSDSYGTLAAPWR